MPKIKKSLIVWVFAGLVGLVVFIAFFYHADPIASLDLRLSKEDAYRQAEEFVKEEGFDLAGFDRTVIFHSDYYASAYLQKTQGIKKSNELIAQGIPVWFWRVRWFRELEKEGYVVDIDPSSGKVLHFFHALLEDTEGKTLRFNQALNLAKAQMESAAKDLTQYELKESGTIEHKKRADHYCVWEKKDFKVQEATLRISVDIYGDSLGRYREYLKIPEKFYRSLSQETSRGAVLAMAARIITFLFTIAGIIVIVVQRTQLQFYWKMGLTFACIVLGAELISFFNSIPLAWSFYPDTVSKFVFLSAHFGNILQIGILYGCMIFAYGVLGEGFSRQLWKTKTPLFDAIRSKEISFSKGATICVVGYSSAFIFLGYVTIFYLVGTKFFNIWMPPDTEYSNILGTTLPFLFPLTIALQAAVLEEFTFRLFAIPFFKRTLRYSWLAVLIPAMVWAFSHAHYEIFPNYVRGIELTLFGIMLGVIFLKYGLECVIITHFVIDAVLAGLPLLKSQNTYYFLSGLAVVAFALVPILALMIMAKVRSARFVKQNT